jgi:hypothetical protein
MVNYPDIAVKICTALLEGRYDTMPVSLSVVLVCPSLRTRLGKYMLPFVPTAIGKNGNAA